LRAPLAVAPLLPRYTETPLVEFVQERVLARLRRVARAFVAHVVIDDVGIEAMRSPAFAAAYRAEIERRLKADGIV